MASRRKVLVVGSGGREHALALRLLESASVAEVLVAPGNAGTASGSGARAMRNVEGDPLEVAVREAPDLVVVGPEGPLVGGLVDRLTEKGIAAFGPTRSAARLEGSKAFMKDFAARHGIRTARHVVVTSPAEVEAAVRGFSTPPVVKADGLAAGKGVVVATSAEQAITAARGMLSGESFGNAGRTVVLEERLMGEEASLHALCDGERVVVMPAAQDHKRIGEGDTGPNTGGMGTYAPAPVVTEALSRRIEREVFERAVQGMASDGTPYRGVLFAGLMITPEGEPMLLEFNVRFGDPETQVLMNVVDGDLGDALEAAARGRLAPQALMRADRHAVCVVLAARGYPATPHKGDPIAGLDAAAAMRGVRVYHAGTEQRGSEVITAGGRVLGVTAVDVTLAAARDRAYAAADAIRFDGMQLRRDIAVRALG
jgi:phosphoribosylamine---glycine ligase